MIVTHFCLFIFLITSIERFFVKIAIVQTHITFQESEKLSSWTTFSGLEEARGNKIERGVGYMSVFLN